MTRLSKGIDPSKVKKIILFGGTNNIDNILNIPPNLKSSFISIFDVMSIDILNQAKTEISELINLIHSKTWHRRFQLTVIYQYRVVHKKL